MRAALVLFVLATAGCLRADPDGLFFKCNSAGGRCVTGDGGYQGCGGCWDSAGLCRPGNSPSACGVSAASCAACSVGENCVAGTCTSDASDGGPCGPGTCSGCCSAGLCVQGNAFAACGGGGAVCGVCSGAQQCLSGICEEPGCGGCVDAEGICQPGTAPAACGSGGRRCLQCSTGDSCEQSQCATPADGGCSGGQKLCNAFCIPDTNCCGSGDCTNGQQCVGGACSCPTGERVCGQACIPDANCCLSTDCPSGSCVQGVCTGSDAGSVCTQMSFFARQRSTSATPNDLAIGDINNDGRPDVATVSASGGTFSIFLNVGDGGFGPGTDHVLGISIPPLHPVGLSIALGDINADGVPDVSVAAISFDQSTLNLFVFANNGTGTLGFPKTLTPTGCPNALAMGDLNGDGLADIVSANGGCSSPQDNELNLFLTDAGSFDGPFGYGSGQSPRGVALADLNGDGRLDMVATNRDDNTVSVYLNDGAGLFAQQVAYPALSSPQALALGDVTGDGKPDIVVASGGPYSVLVNQGRGTFGPPQGGDGGVAQGIALGDFNHDGWLDVAYTLGPAVHIALNQGNGTFVEAWNAPAGTSPGVVRAVDLNGDGKLDLVVIDEGASLFTAFVNTCTP